LHRASSRWIAGAVAAAALAAASTEAAIAQLPDLPDPIPAPTATPPPLPDLPPVPGVPDLPDAPVPPAPVPTLDPPDVPGLPAAPGTAPPSGGSGGGSGAAPTTAPTTANPGTGATDTTDAGGGSATGGAQQRTPAPRAPAARIRARSAARPPGPVHRRERRLRRTVARLSGCLDAIAGAQRRVLVLRAGLGPRRPQTRHAVARRLDTSVRRVARRERRGLRELRDAAGAGRCSAAALVAAARRGGDSAGAGSGRPAAGGTTPAGTDPTTDGAQTGGSGVKDEFRTSGPPEQPDPVAPPAGDGARAPILLLLAVAFLAGFAGVWTLERHRRHGGHVA